MEHLRGLNVIFVFVAVVFFGATVRAQTLDQIGVTALRVVATNVNGSGIRVAQPEAAGTADFEVNPAAVGQPASLFAYYSSSGSAVVFTNAVGTESGHADGVGQNFYGIPNGVATNVAHVDNFDADFFYTNYVASLSLPDIGDAIVNQSFTFGPQSVADQQEVDSEYDNYSIQNKTLFISAADNFGSTAPSSTNVCAPGTSYNCISVGAYQNFISHNSIGPTTDNGRCKPDITALSTATSFSTPQVAGAAALMMQAGLRGDGGSDTNSAADLRTIKALLLNGAVKPIDWTNSNSSPLDARYGAGVLNVLNSYEQLVGGKQSNSVSTTVSLGGAHPPIASTNSIGVLCGWDFSTNTSGTSSDAIKHYYFNATNNFNGTKFTAAATLVWNRQQNQSSINNLSLFLYNCANSNLVACSTSLVDNVEHIYVPQLAAGRYDLQVWKAGGIPVFNIVSAAEPYALAFEIFPQPILNVNKSGNNAALTWPVYPAGFLVETATNLVSSNWTTNNLPASSITNGSNYILLNATNANQFFRLRRPNL